MRPPVVPSGGREDQLRQSVGHVPLPRNHFGTVPPVAEASDLTLALVAGGFTTFGILVKIAYDGLIARRAAKKERLLWLVDDRRKAYEDFLAVVERQRAYEKRLTSLLDRVRAGETEMSDDEQAAFPDSPMPDLVRAFERIRQLATRYEGITAAEAIVRIFGDMAGLSRASLDQPGHNDEMIAFILQRFLDERVAEFTFAYRKELGFGAPAGAPKRWPIKKLERPMSLADSEHFIRAQIPPKKRPPKTAVEVPQSTGD